MSTQVIVVDYGAGNLRSVVRAVAETGATPVVTSAAGDIARAQMVILPGVGAAADTMANLERCGLVEVIRDYIAADRPFMGVCMGLQALMTYSEEGGRHECLDVIQGSVVRIEAAVKVPHMGWNRVFLRRQHPIFDGIADGEYFYFLHSYYVSPDDASTIVATTNYGVEIPAVLARGALVATQFHPEKSGPAGLRMYRNFVASASLAAI